MRASSAAALSVVDSSSLISAASAAGAGVAGRAGGCCANTTAGMITSEDATVSKRMKVDICFLPDKILTEGRYGTFLMTPDQDASVGAGDPDGPVGADVDETAGDAGGRRRAGR